MLSIKNKNEFKKIMLYRDINFLTLYINMSFLHFLLINHIAINVFLNFTSCVNDIL